MPWERTPLSVDLTQYQVDLILKRLNFANFYRNFWLHQVTPPRRQTLKFIQITDHAFHRFFLLCVFGRILSHRDSNLQALIIRVSGGRILLLENTNGIWRKKFLVYYPGFFLYPQIGVCANNHRVTSIKSKVYNVFFYLPSVTKP